MSTIDKRVVELELDNKQFNKEIKSTSSSLDNFKKSLNFDDVSKSIDKLTVSFSAMDIAVMAMISNIANRVTNLGITLVKSLSVDNISSGWSKFEQKTKSVATIMAQSIKIAGKEIEDYTDKMNAVDNQLTKLNWFTDQTSYNFTDMVENIGKFTAAGQDLDKSVDAMMGIANWAALSGQNAQTASRAMYQLAQAMSKGNVQLIDYKSIQNANMDTQEFRQTVLDTAVALGKLTKQGEKYISTTGGKSFTRNSFTESLQDKWFTSEVLTESLKKYSSAVERIYEISEETGLTAAQVMARYGNELDEFGLKAFKAAQEARTFSDTINAIKDAVSTGWLNTAEHFFGSYTESKVLWSDLADSLYDVFAAGGDVRNQILKIWSSLDGRKDLFAHDPANPENQGAFWNIYDAIVSLVDVFKGSFRKIFSLSEFSSLNEYVNDTANKFKSLTKSIQDSTKRFKEFIQNNKLFSNSIQTIFGGFKIILSLLKATRYAIDPIVSVVTNFFKNILSNISNRLSNITWLEQILEKISVKAIEIKNNFEKLIDKIATSDSFYKIISGLRTLISSLKEAKILEKVSKLFSDFFNSFVDNGGTIENFKTIAIGVANAVSLLVGAIKKASIFIITTIGPTLYKALSNVFKIAGAILGKLIELTSLFFKEISKLASKNKETSIFDNIVDFINSLKLDKAAITMADTVASVIMSLRETFINLLSILQYTLPLVNAILKITSIIVKEVNTYLTNILNKAAENGGIKVLLLGFLVLLTVITSMVLMVSKTTKKAIKLLDSLKQVMYSVSYALNASAFLSIANALLLLSGAFYLLSKIDLKSLGSATIAINVITAALMGLYLFAYELTKYGKDVSASTFSKNVNQLLKISSAFMMISYALGNIAKAMQTFSSIDDPSAMTNMFTGMITSIVTLFVILKIVSNFRSIKISDSFKLIISALSIVGSLLLLLKAISQMSSIDTGSFFLGMLKIVSAMLMFGGLLKVIDTSFNTSLQLLGKLLFISVISTVFKAISRSLTSIVKYSEMVDWVALLSSIGKITLIVSYMLASIKMMSKMDKGNSKIFMLSLSIAVFSTALRLVSKNLSFIADIPFSNILKSILNLSAVLATLLALSKVVSKPSKFIALSASLIFLSEGLLFVSSALKAISNIDFVSMIKALANIAATFGIISLMSNLKTLKPLNIVAIGVSLIFLSSALETYTESISSLANISMSAIFKGLLALAAGLGLLAIAARIMEPSISSILKLSFAILILGGSMLITAIALATLSEQFNMNMETMWETLSSFLNGALDFLTANSEKVIKLVETILMALLQAIIDLMPKIGETVTAIIKMVLQVLRDCLPDILSTVVLLINGVLKMLKENIRQWTADLTYILIELIDELTSHLPELIDALTEFLTVFIESSLNSLASRLTRILNAAITFVLKLIKDLGVTIKNRSREFSETFIEFGINLMEGLKIGIVSGLAKLLEQIPMIGNTIANGFRSIFGIHSPSTVMEEMGMYLDKGLAKGVKENAKPTANSISDSMSKVLSAVDDTLNNEIDDSLVLTPVIDLSKVNAGAKDISALMSSISGTTLSVTGRNAILANDEISRYNKQAANTIQNGSTTTNTDNYYVTFNVETNNPEELAQQLDQILQRNRLKSNLAKGGY